MQFDRYTGMTLQKSKQSPNKSVSYFQLCDFKNIAHIPNEY